MHRSDRDPVALHLLPRRYSRDRVGRDDDLEQRGSLIWHRQRVMMTERN